MFFAGNCTSKLSHHPPLYTYYLPTELPCRYPFGELYPTVLTFSSVLSSIMACNAYSVWNKWWALAYKWETLVQSRQFRVQSTDHYYAVHSNTKLYRDEGPGVFNYCPRCAGGHIHDCLFFHSSLASLFLDVIQSLDKSKSDDELDNLEVQSRIYTQLPGYFTKLGYPCEKATIWSCVQDKIDQTFPVGSLVMVNIPYYLKCREEEMERWL